jgi:dipeptidyl aminopeptidase/acylaminoacyl peptidase
LIVHGANDQTVPVRQAWELDQMLKAKHIQSTLLVVPGADHNVLAADAVVWPKVLTFFQIHLKATQ